MPRYYFDVSDRKGSHRDDVGEDFVNFEEAIAQAQAILPDIAREEMPDGDQHDICLQRKDRSRSPRLSRKTYVPRETVPALRQF